MVLVILVFSALVYFRVFRINNPQPASVGSTNLPQSSDGNLEDRVKVLEDALGIVTKKLTVETKQPAGSASPPVQNQSGITEARIKGIEDSLAALKIKIDQITPVAQKSSALQPTLYIPLGSSSTSNDRNWYSMNTHQVEIDPGNYPGYSGMQLEVVMKLNESVGTANARLFNSTDNSAITYSDVSTASDKYIWLASSSFKLPSGNKTYKLQLQSTQGYEISIQSARIKVNF